MSGNSRVVISNQVGMHPDLHELVSKHLTTRFAKPYQPHSVDAFQRCQQVIQQHQKPLILDSGCGIGMSTAAIAQQYPDHWVIGIDRSSNRLNRNQQDPSFLVDGNKILIRADLEDFWRLAVEQGWTLAKHYLLYPNPYPKKKHIQRRWHGHPVFSALLALGGDIELRSNWPIYLEEFVQAVEIANYGKGSVQRFTPSSFLTPFEKKYFDSNQALYKAVIVKTTSHTTPNT